MLSGAQVQRLARCIVLVKNRKDSVQEWYCLHMRLVQTNCFAGVTGYYWL